MGQVNKYDLGTFENLFSPQTKVENQIAYGSIHLHSLGEGENELIWNFTEGERDRKVGIATVQLHRFEVKLRKLEPNMEHKKIVQVLETRQLESSELVDIS